MNEDRKKLGMGKSESDLFAHWRTEGLTVSEKSEMRTFLRENAVVPSGFSRLVKSHISPFQIFSFRQAFSMSLVLIIVIVSSGVGVAKASEQSLPGDTLYVVKTGITEPFSGFFRRTSEEKAAWARTLAERRMEEANELASSGKLGEKESQEIGGLLERHHETLKRYTNEDDDTFENEIDRQFEKIELKIEIREGGREYRIREREEKREESEEEKSPESTEENHSSETEDDDGMFVEKNEDSASLKREAKDVSEEDKKSSSGKKIESKKSVESVKIEEPKKQSTNDEKKADSSGSNSGKDEESDDLDDQEEDTDDEDEDDKGDDEDDDDSNDDDEV